MTPVVTADEMRALEQVAIAELGIPAFTLMETAGRGVADAVLELDPVGHVAVVCGPGNNGGDGFVIARVLRQHDVDAVAYLAVGRDAVKGDAAKHLAILEKSGGVVLNAMDRLDDIAGADIVVDALFGTGLTRKIEGKHADSGRADERGRADRRRPTCPRGSRPIPARRSARACRRPTR